MTHIKQVLEKFDEKFGKPQVDKDGELFFERSVGHSAGCDDCYTNQKEREEHKSFLLSSHTSYLEKQIEWLRGEMKSTEIARDLGSQETIYAESFNSALQSVIDHLQEELKEIKEI